MKRILLLFSLLLCGVVHVVAQPQVKKYTHKFDNGDYYDEVYPAGYYTGSCTWDSVKVPCTFCLRHYMFSNNKEECVFYIHLEDSDLKKFVKGVFIVEIQLSNNEIFIFDVSDDLFADLGTYDGDQLMVILRPFSNYREYKSSYRSDDEIDNKAVASSYFYNQLSLYDIKAIRFNESQTFIPQFKSSEHIKSLVAELRSTLTDKKPLPDINNLDRSWAQKRVGTEVYNLKGNGYRAEWDRPLRISMPDDIEVNFRFAIEKSATEEVPLIIFLCDGYEMPKRESNKVSISITLSNGARYQVFLAQANEGIWYDVHMSAKLSSFYQHQISNKLHPKTILQQLATYDIEEVTIAQCKYNLRNANGSTADAFATMCKALLEKTGAADLYALNTPAPAVRPTTTTPKKTTTAKPTASATKTYKVGDYYADDTTKGFVFQVSEDGLSGKIISLKQADLPWYQGPQKEKPRKMGLENEKFGLLNLVKLRHNEGWHEHFPAFAWCADLGNGWYLPATGELEEIAKQSKVLNEAMLRFPGAHGLSGVYWASNEDGLHEERAWATPHYGGTSSMPKSNVQHVRAIACFKVDATAASSKPVQKTTSAAQPQPVTKPTETTTKPTPATKQEQTGFLLTAHNKLKYARYIARYDHIAPSQLMNTPLALVTSRAIPMDALLEIVDGAKGVGKVTVSTSSDGKQKSATVHPTEFYCRLRGFEEVPCSLMSVGYDADNTQQIKTATFTYDLPASWKRAKVKEYAKAFSEDMHRLGMRWSEANDSYVGSHEGHYIQIRYGGKGADNFIYVYIRYAEEQ